MLQKNVIPLKGKLFTTNIHFNVTRTLLFVGIILFLNRQMVLKHRISGFHG
jgi:hypothetical protein